MSQATIDFIYLISSVLFILGLKGMTHPKTAVRGNLIGSLGMLLAIITTLFDHEVLTWSWIFVGLIIGSAIGLVLAQRTPMTSMPQMVALLNGLGGAASFLVAGAFLGSPSASFATRDVIIATGLSGLIGAVTLSGSLVAWAKLEELPQLNKIPKIPNPPLFNAALSLGVLILLILQIAFAKYVALYWLLVIASLVLGYCITIPIGGADMPVVIALLNSYSGLAGAATGFVLQNYVLIITGSLVGASGIILSQIMCQAMNRSLVNVLFGTIGGSQAKIASADEVYKGLKSTSAEEIAMLLEVAQRVVIVPGYGMAVAQAQHAVRELTSLLQKRGATVEFGIHPVAGRMPGHMNVLLAEADIPYDLMKEMDEINRSMEQTDVCLVIGANDTVNPDARTNPTSPIAGMPIINADKARTCVVIKRSLSPGFAGIPNPLFACQNSLMFFADGRKGIVDIVNALQQAT